MRTHNLLFVVGVALFFACANGFPAIETSEESDEKPNTNTVLILPRNFNIDDDDSLEAPSSFWRSSSSLFDMSGFNYFIRAMQQAMAQLRKEMIEETKKFSSNEGSSLLFGKIPEGANTTSTTKVIDGHVVTVNETTYSNGDDSQGIHFRIRVVDIKPQNDTISTVGSEESDESKSTTEAASTTTSTTSSEGEKDEGTTPGRSVETVEEMNNEIPKNSAGDLTA